jgi:hypothetical protein
MILMMLCILVQLKAKAAHFRSVEDLFLMGLAAQEQTASRQLKLTLLGKSQIEIAKVQIM